MLSELRTRTQATNDVLNVQFNKLLDKMLVVTQESEQNAADDATSSPAENFEVYLQEMRSALLDLKKEVNNSSRARSNGDRDALASSESERAYRRKLFDSRQWPSRKMEQELWENGLGDLDQSAALLLDRFARSY